MVIDLGPATRRMAGLVAAVADEQLDAPTPCPAYTLGDLVDHVGGLALAFTAAARQAGGDATRQQPSGNAARLGDGWRGRIARDLDVLADAWRRPSAWSGTTWAGGVELPGDVAGLVVLDELVIHGWDLARASGQPYDCEPQLLEILHPFVASFAAPGAEAQREGLFGPVVAVPRDAPLLARIVGLAGRDPAWAPLDRRGPAKQGVPRPL